MSEVAPPLSPHAKLVNYVLERRNEYRPIRDPLFQKISSLEKPSSDGLSLDGLGVVCFRNVMNVALETGPDAVSTTHMPDEVWTRFQTDYLKKCDDLSRWMLSITITPAANRKRNAEDLAKQVLNAVGTSYGEGQALDVLLGKTFEQVVYSASLATRRRE